MQFSNKHWALSLDLNGGRIQELSHREVKVFGTYTRTDGKMGNTHLCIPSFDKEGQEKYGLPFHGLVRNIPWTIKNKSADSVVIECKTASSVLYPAQLSVEQEFKLGTSFIHTIRVAHSGGGTVPLNMGCHYYWNTPKGWGQSLLDDVSIENGIQTNGYVELQEKSTIRFPHASYVMNTQGFHTAVLWTSFKTIENDKKEYSQDFCCIEPVIGWPKYFGSEKSMLKNGEVKTVSMSLCAGERTCSTHSL